MEKPFIIKWKRLARKQLRSIDAWYQKNLGIAAANKFSYGIIETVDLLAFNPHLGKIEPETKLCKKCYYSFVEHRNHKIIYYVDKNTIYIADIWANNQNPENLSKQLK